MKIPHVGYEVTKEVGKLVQELQGMLELCSCWRQYKLLGHWLGDDCHCDGGRRVGRHGGAQSGKGGHQGVEKG